MPVSDSLQENDRKNERKCAQTKTQERENLCGVFQMVASAQAAEQWPCDLLFVKCSSGSLKEIPEATRNHPVSLRALPSDALYCGGRKWRCVAAGGWGRMWLGCPGTGPPGSGVTGGVTVMWGDICLQGRGSALLKGDLLPGSRPLSLRSGFTSSPSLHLAPLAPNASADTWIKSFHLPSLIFSHER